MIDKLSAAFSAIVRRDLRDNLAEIQRRNASREYASIGACATHDFFDANVLMGGAFKFTMGRGVDIQSDEDVDLWNAAWTKARAEGFKQGAIVELIPMGADPEDPSQLDDANNYDPPLAVVMFEAVDAAGNRYEDIAPHALPAFLQAMGFDASQRT